jgi:hypothetical protein
MSVRATERIIGDVVIVTAFPKSPQMVAHSIDEKSKLITTVWFTPANEYQQGTFPAASLDRVEAKPKPKVRKSAKAKPASRSKQRSKK